MKALKATAVDVVVPDLAAQLTASNLLTQELKFYLGDYLKKSGGPVASVEELLASGLHASQLQGFLDNANAIRTTTSQATITSAVLRLEQRWAWQSSK